MQDSYKLKCLAHSRTWLHSLRGNLLTALSLEVYLEFEI